jgi:hypothetical protein
MKIPSYVFATQHLMNSIIFRIINTSAMENMLGNTMGTWETYWEPNQNPLGIFKENMVRTYWEHIGSQ